MRIFTRRREVARNKLWQSWLPESDDVLICPAEAIGDPQITAARAYGAQFYREDCPASLTIWAYARWSPEGFIVGFRIDREINGAGSGEPSDQAYCADYMWAEWFRSAADADGAAHAVALMLLIGDRDALSLYVQPAIADGCFAWDGDSLP